MGFHTIEAEKIPTPARCAALPRSLLSPKKEETVSPPLGPTGIHQFENRSRLWIGDPAELSPNILEGLRTHRGIAHRVGDRGGAEIVL